MLPVKIIYQGIQFRRSSFFMPIYYHTSYNKRGIFVETSLHTHAEETTLWGLID